MAFCCSPRCFHFAIATKEIVEAALPGGTLNPPSKARLQYKRALEYLSRYGIHLCSGGYLVPARTLANPIAR